jgi:hypothetical protein
MCFVDQKTRWFLSREDKPSGTSLAGSRCTQLRATGDGREEKLAQRRGRTVQSTGKRGSGRNTQAVPVRTVLSR